MSNSSLVNYTRISPNSNNPRNAPIKKITIHHMAGNLSVETCGNVFAPTNRQASSNYGVDSNGRVGMYVEEKNRSWCSSSPSNDHQAVTIEVANDEIGGNWHVSDRALSKVIELCVDICKRNDMEKLIYTGDKNGTLTRHNMFANTSCPGPYLQSKFDYIANEVNKRLNQTPTPAPTPDKSIEDTAREVIRGDWGNGDNRKNRLSNAGYNYSQVQSRVNELLGINLTPTPDKSIEDIAREVIRGDWGNGDNRKNRLNSAGYNYSQVQSRVNELLNKYNIKG